MAETLAPQDAAPVGPTSLTELFVAFTLLAPTMVLAMGICRRLEWKAPVRVGTAMPVGIAGLPARHGRHRG